MQMNPCMHKANSLADIALAECKQYLPLIGCLSIMISLYVVSGLNI